MNWWNRRDDCSELIHIFFFITTSNFWLRQEPPHQIIPGWELWIVNGAFTREFYFITNWDWALFLERVKISKFGTKTLYLVNLGSISSQHQIKIINTQSFIQK